MGWFSSTPQPDKLTLARADITASQLHLYKGDLGNLLERMYNKDEDLNQIEALRRVYEMLDYIKSNTDKGQFKGEGLRLTGSWLLRCDKQNGYTFNFKRG